ATKAQMEDRQSQLQVERESLQSHARIENMARVKLKMERPTSNQVLLAREYVPSGDGLSMAGPPAAAAEEPAPSRPGVRGAHRETRGVPTDRRRRAAAQDGRARLGRIAALRLESRSAAMNDRATVDLRRRTMVLAALVALAFLGVLGRLTYLQVVKHDEYAKLAESQQAKTIPLVARRGPILDRNGQVLAVSAKAESLYALTSRVEDKDALAAQLAPIL